MKTQIIIAFALVVVGFFATVIQFCRCVLAFKEYKACKQKIDELTKKIKRP